jgi:hypothetical protein
MEKYNFEKILPELRIVRLILKIYTILHIPVAIMFFTLFTEIGHELISGIYIVFIMFFLSFMWFRLPMSRHNKIGETFLIILFGLFALWMWIPNEKKIKEMVNEYNPTQNKVYN